VVPRAAVAVAVVATDPCSKRRRRIALLRRIGSLLLATWFIGAHAAVLPEDRVDVMYHGYSGGGLTVQGPYVLVRKGFEDRVSLWGNWYVDLISSASIDVVSTASPYDETRREFSGGVDYLRGKTLMSISYTDSYEDDYSGRIVNFSISQDFFGDLTTLSLGYGYGWDDIRRNDDDEFGESSTRHAYRVGLTQVLSRNLIVMASYEGVSDQGFLGNAYRSARYLDPTTPRGFSFEPEAFPSTRTSNALALRARYFLPHRAAITAGGRYYSDTWDIRAWDAEVGYVHTRGEQLTFEVSYRYYQQTSANFFADLFPRSQHQNYLARDKELSEFTSHAVGFGVNYRIGRGWIPFASASEASLYVDHIRFDYAKFRDLRDFAPPGEERLYGFGATVVRALLSVWF
jgi:hypothetical protein